MSAYGRAICEMIETQTRKLREDLDRMITIKEDTMSEWKPTNNPKDSLGTAKAPIHLVPSSSIVAMSMAFLEGREKYGQYNWRVTGVRASVYQAAMMRHMMAWWDGENIDPDSGLPHLWKAMACLAILIDASELEALEDDRPPRAPTAELMEFTKEMGEEIRERLEDFIPYQYTELNRADGPQADPGPLRRTLGTPEELEEPQESPQDVLDRAWEEAGRRGFIGVDPAKEGSDRSAYLPIPCPECGARATFVDRVPGTEYDVTYRCPTHKEFELVVIDGQYAVQR